MRKRSMAAWAMVPVAAVLALAVVRPGASGAGPVPGRGGPSGHPFDGTYDIDVVHSELSFRIRHLIGRVAGNFTEWEGVLHLDPLDLSGGSVEVVIQTASINTFQEQRDDHLRSPDFFAADSFPTIEYRSRRVDVDGTD